MRPIKPAKESMPALDPRVLLAAIVNSSDDAIISKTLEGTISSWNQGAERIYGYRAEEVIGKPITLLAPPERAEEISGILEKIGRGERVEHFQSIRVAKDGRRLTVSITVSPIRDADGKIIGASTIARDLSGMVHAREALEESEFRADALFEAAAQAIFIVDAKGKIVRANPATQKMFGYSPQDLIGRPIELLIPERLHRGHETYRQQYFAHPQTRPMGMGLDLQARRKDGSEFFVEISLSYAPSPSGTLAVAFVSDISKRRADEESIRQQREDLRNLAARLMSAQDEERRRIARDLHDDLSQQLAYLSIDLGKLATKPGAQDLLGDLRPLQLRAAEAAETVRRISHQLHPSVLDDIGLEAALEQYCEEFQARSGIATQFSSRNVPESLNTQVAASIYHIAQECLRNVAKHSRSDRVSVRLEAVDDVLRLTVKDRGVGLANKQPEIKGIGLVAMKERAHLVNGNLSVQSKSGEGTEVSVEVPIDASA